MSKFIDSLGLNIEQREAVETEGVHQLVFAGAGTGKTKVLTAKIAWLVKDKGVSPYNIFAATFTNKAAKEMRERVTKLTSSSCDNLWIGTFHSLCVRILRREADRIGYSRNFSIYDSGDQQALIKSVMKDSLVDEKTLQPRAVLNIISSYKNRTISPDDAVDMATAFYEKEIAALYSKYQEALKKSDAMDFDDLIYNVVELFKTNTQLALEYQDRFRYVLVDEYQDTNGVQFKLIKALAGGSNPIFAVGDDDQSIYGWRGADIDNILNFETIFPGTSVHKLEQNYRSTKPILDFANSIISKNSRRAGKKLWTDKTSSDEVLVRAFSDDRKEAQGICSDISKKIESGVKPGTISLLFRTNAQSRLFEDGLRKAKVPYVLIGGTSFYERKEIKDVLAYVKLLVNPKDSISCQRVLNTPARGIGAKSQEKIAIAAKRKDIGFFEIILSGEAEGEISGKAKKGVARFREVFGKVFTLQENGATPEQLVTEILTETGYLDSLIEQDSEEAKSRIENINELINAVTEWQSGRADGNLAQFLEDITLSSDIDNWDRGEAVNLMTLHTAKGLEFDYVYLVGVEDGLIPSRQNFDDPQKVEEERRLMYVGSTRAQKHLICSYAETRMRFGSIMPMGMSRFIKDISNDLFRLIDETAQFTTLGWNDDFTKNKFNRNRGSNSSGGSRVVRHNSASTVKKQEDFSQANGFDDFNQEHREIRMGNRVRHGKFGNGKVMNISGFGPDTRITVIFEGGVRKQLIAKFAKLEIL